MQVSFVGVCGTVKATAPHGLTVEKITVGSTPNPAPRFPFTPPHPAETVCDRRRPHPPFRQPSTLPFSSGPCHHHRLMNTGATRRVLPIHAVESDLLAGLQSTGAVALAAPTGSGKSTQVPQILLRAGLLDHGDVIILQPRRLAARLLARRVAEELNVRLGDEVGYQVRFENRTSSKTRIRFLTEGILTRRLLEDPDLSGVAALIFDEFHERHLASDLALALAKPLRLRRPDLKLIVMSATLDIRTVADFLNPCTQVTAEGRTFPVEVIYLPRKLDPDRDPVWEAAANAWAQGGFTPADGHALIFMPGAYEISRTVQALRNRRETKGWKILPLHGEMPPAEQDVAVASEGSPKIIVSTNVAETSLTIDGVGIVIDSGLAKIARYDPRRGVDALLTEPISRASADQRAGRAGRTRAGRCIRLWTEYEDRTRRSHDTPEIRRVDLAETVLHLHAMDVPDPASFGWFDPPEPIALDHATELLRDLGALDPDGKVTPIGQELLTLPLHPRHGRMLRAARELGVIELACVAAGVTQGRPLLLGRNDSKLDQARERRWGDAHRTDLAWPILAALEADHHRFDLGFCETLGIHAGAARTAMAVARQLAGLMSVSPGERTFGPEDWRNFRRCMMAGFADRIARRLDRGTLRCALVHGQIGFLERESRIRDDLWLVGTEVRETRGPDGKLQLLLGGASAIDETWLHQDQPEGWTEEVRIELDPVQKTIVRKTRQTFRGILAGELIRPADDAPDDAARILADEVLAGRCRLENWNHEVEQWIARINRVAEWCPELNVPPITDGDKRALIEQICYGARSPKEVRDRPVLPAIKSWLSPTQLAAVESMAPVRLPLPGGRPAKVTYRDDHGPVVSAKIQDLYGLDRPLTIAGGRVTVTLELLAPNLRPVQVTTDPKTFWAETYPKLKIELKRRYPKHEWR